MDTNAKSFKYSLTCKLICFFISFATFMASAGLALYTGMSISYRYEDNSANWYESDMFKNEFINDTRLIAKYTQSQYILDDAQRKKEKITDEIYNKFLEKRKSNTGEDIEISATVNDYISDFSFSANANDIDSVTKEDIENEYDLWINEEYYYICDTNLFHTLSKSKSIKYYCIDNRNNNVVTNLENRPSENDILNREFSAVIHAGIPSPDTSLSYILSDENINERTYNDKNTDLYIYIDTSVKAPDKYIDLIAFINHSNKINANPVKYIVLSAVMMIISFTGAFIFFSATGKKSALDENGKLILIDYLPFELHIAIAGGAITGLTLLMIALADTMAPYYRYYMLCVAGALTAGWLLLFEVSSSIKRYAKSEKKLYKGFLIYDIGALIFIIIRFFIRLDIKIAKRNHRRFKAMFYNPKSFKRNVTAVNIAVLFHIIFWMFWCIVFANTILSPVFSFIAILPVIIAIPFIIKYFIQLDTIIIASVNHEDSGLDLQKLPQSLKMLAQSMKYTNNELQSAVNRAVKDERLRTELITNVSHDLKTPLTSIINYVDLLSRCPIKDETAIKYIKILDEKGAKLKRLIDDLIEASKVTSGNIHINPINLNLSELCVQATVENQTEFEKSGLELIIKPGEESPIVFADGAKTFRILENLLSNARKYSARASRVYASVYREGKWGVFEIKNISAQMLDITPDELTERFVRGDKARAQEGSGLGLSIAKELCKAQNGELEISIDGDLFKAKVKLPLV